MEPIKISVEESQAICWETNPDFIVLVEETNELYTDNGGRWLTIVRRVSDGATFAIQREMENENCAYGEQLIPVECTQTLVTHTVWHRPGAFEQPGEPQDADDLIRTLGGLL